MRTAHFSSSVAEVCPTPPGCRPPLGRPPASTLPDGDSPCEQIDRCKNITLPQTLFTGGKDLLKHTYWTKKKQGHLQHSV